MSGHATILIVGSFDDPNGAETALKQVKAKAGHSVHDAALVARDVKNQLHIRDTTNGEPIQNVLVEVVPLPANEAVSAAPTIDPTALPGSTWNAVLFNDGGGQIVGVTGVQITAQFGADGQLAGFSGCNDYSAGYTTGPDSNSTFGPIAATQKACSAPANVMEQEAQYLAALQSAVTYQIQGQQLSMQDSAGELAVQFVRAGQ
jgi:heat shock protein HslJ